MDYLFARLDLTDDSEQALARRTGYLEAIRRGFHQSRVEEEFEKHWLTHARADDAECRGAWLPEGEFGAGPVPVATFCWFDKDLNAGHERLPLRMITDVTTSPAHRRRGLVRRMMEDCLNDAADQGLPAVALTASEATIYGRWGFGVAVFASKIEVETSSKFGLRDFTDPGRVELIEPPGSWPVVRDVFDRFHAVTRGSVQWPQFYETLHSGAYDFDDGGQDKKARGAVHLAADGTVDGVVLYRIDDKGDKRKVAIMEMMALNPPAGLGLWQFLGSIDLVDQVTWSLATPDDPLQWALTDINVLRHTGLGEFLWLRILDVARTFAARPWAADGQVVLKVSDPQDYAAGRYLVQTAQGRAEVTRTEEPADLELTVETLGSLSLGAARVHELHAAGRLHGNAETVARFAAMADLPTPPYCLTGF